MCDFFSKSPKAPFNFVLIFCSKLKFQKAQRVPPFEFFGNMRLFRNSHFSFFRKFFIISEGSPFQFFDILQQTGLSKSWKGPPFTISKPLHFLSFGYSADFRSSRLFNNCIDYFSEKDFFAKQTPRNSCGSVETIFLRNKHQGFSFLIILRCKFITRASWERVVKLKVLDLHRSYKVSRCHFLLPRAVFEILHNQFQKTPEVKIAIY